MKRPLVTPRVCIIGLGLIGGSLGAAWRRSGAVERVIGYDPDEAAREIALQRGAVDETCDDAQTAISQADTVVLAAPVDAVIAMAETVCQAAIPGSVITDVCSVKRPVVARYQECLQGKASFVGGHPMAGSERQGAAAADPLLFENAAYVITPAEGADPAAVHRVEALARAVGAHPVLLDADAHDRAVAGASHLPQIVASTLMLTVGRQRIDTAAGVISPVMLAGGGLRDTTRIAASPARMWREILLSNADEILRQLDEFEAVLSSWRQALQEGDGDTLTALFSEAAQLRASVRAAQRDILPSWPELMVRIADRPGVLAQITGVLGDAGINIADVEIVRAREGEPEAIRIALTAGEDIQRAMNLLIQAGFEVRMR